MKINWHMSIVLLFAILSSHCKSAKIHENKGTLTGTIRLVEGNCMPAPDKLPCKSIPYSTTIYVTLPAEEYNPENLVDSTKSEGDGSYSITLQAGSYSVFVLDGVDKICTEIRCPTEECICSPVEVITGRMTERNLTIDNASW